MEDIFSRFWENLLHRPSGPLGFRFILQPVLAFLFAVRDGLKDASAGRPAYFWTIFFSPDQRRSLLHEGWNATAKVCTVACLVDILYQLMVFHRVYPLEALTTAFTLGFVPYLFMRGPVNRIARRIRTLKSH